MSRSIECACCDDYDDFDPIRCYTEIERKARKPHRCVECRETITPGQRYMAASGIGAEGDPFRYNTCLPCFRIRQHYCPGSFAWGELRSRLHECLGFDYVTGPGEKDRPDAHFDGNVPLTAP